MNEEGTPGIPSESGAPPPRWSMRTYVVSFLYRGAYQPADPAKAEELQREHLVHISRLLREHKAIVVGPLLDDSDLRGICIFDSESVEEIRTICLTDPGVRAGAFRVEVHPWYGPKGITFVPPRPPAASGASE
ncbi:MAG TPA: YciI family protein [Candidatus Angelobacter sp.]|nr:YciI family protein [Candidatus Angelobacter sp.]